MNSVGVEEVHQFFADWQKLSQINSSESQLEKWQQFFSEWKSFTSTTPIEKKSTKFDCEQFEKFVCAFSKPYDEYRRSGAFMNIWRITGLGKDEVKNSAVLSWMLDRTANHGQDSAILEKLMEFVESISDIGIDSETIRENNYWVKTESLPLDEIHSRVDIEVESSAFLIFIEVKISAPETSNQLERYIDLVKYKAAGKPWVVIFLTPTGRNAKDIKLHEWIIPISWKQLAVILDKYSYELNSGFMRHTFKSYADFIRDF